MNDRRVVIADDDPDIRGLIRISCRKAGLTVVAETADGDDALAAILRERPELAILDVSMPGMSGLQVCRHLREDDSLAEVRILLLSAAVDEHSIRAGLEAGANDYLAKPFSPRQLAVSLAEQWATLP